MSSVTYRPPATFGEMHERAYEVPMPPAVREAWLIIDRLLMARHMGQPAQASFADRAFLYVIGDELRADLKARCPYWSSCNEAERALLLAALFYRVWDDEGR